MTITATELKENLGQYLDMAMREEIVITKNGKPVAKMVNPFMEKIEMLHSLTGILSTDMTLEEARRERIEKKCAYW